MKIVYGALLLFLVMLLTLSLISCSVVDTLPSKEPLSTMSPHAPFDGDFRSYEYWYEKGRDRDWEEDILYLAGVFLEHEPRLIEKTNVFEFGNDTIRYTDEFFDQEMRSSFIDEIGLLIPQISELSDMEILYELQRIIATLDDAHSRIFVPSGNLFPINFVEMFENDGVSLYVVTAPTVEENLLWGKLESINDVSADEILERLATYHSSENKYSDMYYFTTSYAFITWQNALSAIGVIEHDASTAEFKVSFVDDIIVSAELALYSSAEVHPQWTDVRMSATGSLMYENYDQNYWAKYIPEDNMVYVRINVVEERSDLPYVSLWNEIINMINSISKAPKVVFDLRGNPGGQYPLSGFDSFINSLNCANKEGVYVLIDNGVYSSAVTLAAELRQKVENAVLVGLPAGEPPNMFGVYRTYALTFPNNGYIFNVSDRAFVSWPGYEGEALMPDVEVHPTIEKYKQGVDTILDAVMNIE